MRTVEAHLLGDKIDEAVTYYINTHHPTETVHIDPNLSLNVQDDGGGRVVTVMHPQGYQQQVGRQISVGEQIGDGPWVEELWDGRLAALVSHLAQPSRSSHHQGQHMHHKTSTVLRSDMDTSVILDGSMRLFNSQSMDHHQEQLTVQVADLPLPSLQEMKRCPDTSWFNKDKDTLKGNTEILEDSQMLEMASCSPAQSKQNKKSLPHKKRISRKLKRNTGNTTPSQRDIVVIQCNGEVHPEQEEILPDSFVDSLPRHADHLPHDAHVPHMRAILICQLCGQFFGEEQLKFYQHLRHHYEPPTTLTIDNAVPDIAMDKITNTCIVDNGATLPDSIVELSLENTVPKTMYQPIDKHMLYDKQQLYKYSMDMQKAVERPMDDTLDKLEIYCCVKCNKSFRKQKQCEAHIREVHSMTKIEDMGEFSEPEDLMEGIHVAVDEEHDQEQLPEPVNEHTSEQTQDVHEQYESVLPHLTVDNGHVHQDHIRHWYSRSGAESPEVGPLCACGGAGCCHVCAPPYTQQRQQIVTRELQKILETDVPAPENPVQQEYKEIETHDEIEKLFPKKGRKKANKKFECVQCGRVFQHRNSMLYHLLMHQGKKHACADCGKRFYTAGSLKVHKRTHDGVKPCECDVCGQRFRRSGDLKYHKDSKHSTKKPFKCEFCVKEFARRYSLSIHRRIHTGERNYKCDYCPKSFRAASYKQIHMRVHTGSKPHQCTQCDKSFRVPYDLRRHVRIVHDKIKKDEDPKKNKDKTAKKEDKQKNKEAKKKPIQKPPNVTVQSKCIKLTELDNGLNQCKNSFYYTDHDIKQEIKLRNEMNDDKLEFRENTDGKMPIFSQVEKSPNVTLGDLRSLDISRDRDLHGDIEMFDKLALYNIPPV